MEPTEFLLIFLVTLVASFIGNTVGGSGLISIPAYIFMGLPPKVAIATDQVALVFMNVIGLVQFGRAGKVDWKLGVPIAIIGGLGAVIGAVVLIEFPEELIEKLIGIVILLVSALILTRKEIGIIGNATPSPTHRVIGFILFTIVGIWAGFFSAGFGIFASYILLSFFGKTFSQSVGTLKVLSVFIIAVTISMFSAYGLIHWEYFVPLALGTTVGSFLGVRFAVTKGEGILKILFLIVTFVSGTKLLLF